MTTLLQLKSISKSFGARHLFQDVSFTINDDEHVGVIGQNGAGKTTLFDVIIGKQEPDNGTMTKSTNLHIAYLSQHDDFTPDETAEDYIMRVANVMSWEVQSQCADFDIDKRRLQKKISTLSGGYKMRCKLLGLSLQKADLLLLDEPSNYLDLDTILVLERFLQGFSGAFMVISHDQEFLRRTTDHILEIEGGEATKFNGNLDDYFEQKQILREQLEAHAASLKERRDEILRFVARFGAKATKARQAQSRLKRLDKMETVEVKPIPVSAKIKIPPPTHCGKVALTIKDADLGYGNNRILRNVSFTVQRGDHIVVTGANGRGKTTLLKSLAGAIPLLNGTLELGYEVSLAYYAQHVSEQLKPERTVLEELVCAKDTSITEQDAKNLAGTLLFTKDDMNKKIKILSGGEKSRVALGCVLLKKVNFLLLDEPTNHLDFQTTAALSQALHEYGGAIIVVSHDRAFVRTLSKKTIEVQADGTVAVYPGTYDEYVWSLQRRLRK
ncbi:MAG: ATP-binding cassette domain-containing protein [Holosporales bacterium]|jgi:ATP-binding cassette subfamily F protein 3|nr:ATP-binding cassette domain-containing protein [Holosporales bacterium]